MIQAGIQLFQQYRRIALLPILLSLSYFCLAEAQKSNEAIKNTVNTSQWQPNILDWETSPVNLSFLNAEEKPAGKRGFIKAKGEQLVFEDGTVAKFWGVNIVAYTVFNTSKENIKQQAKKLSEMGFNLVRIHHMDSPWVTPNLFETDAANNTKTISIAAIDQLDWWVKCLKEEGIYVWLDLHVQRAFRKGDGITDFAEISKGTPEADLKGYNYVNESMQKAMQAFNAAYLTHRNAYTGKLYTEEPAIMAVLLTNENDLPHHFGNALLPNKGVKAHSARYMKLAESFANKHGLDKDKVWRSWEHGASKVFLNDLEYQFNAKMISHLRGIHLKVPIATTSFWGDSALSVLPALTSGDIIDAHAYGGAGALKANPLHTDHLIHWLAAAQVVGKPMSVTEWNADPFPTEDRQVLPMYVATQSSFQGWDALMLYAYSQSVAQAPQAWTRASNWDSMYDPSIMATMPAAALMYRRGDVKEATSTYVLTLDDAFFNQEVTPANSVFIRTAIELGKLQIAMPAHQALPWLKKSTLPVNANVFKNPNQTLIKPNTNSVKNDDFARDWQQGNMTINTSKTQAIVGNVVDKKISLNDIEWTSKTSNVVVIVQSLDTAPINGSTNIMISLAARSVASADNKLPFLSEPVEGRLSVKAAKGLKLFKQNSSQKEQQVPMQYQDGKYLITLDSTLNTYWLSLRNPTNSNQQSL
ncbi:MAG: cellulase family glycosylhydrolase [Methylophilaceae bacterium]